MYLEIDSRNSDRVFSQVYNHLMESRRRAVVEDKSKPLSEDEVKALIKKDFEDLESTKSTFKKIADASETLDKQVKLSINRDINRVIITIIEKDSGRVIVEIPCKELQDLDKHLKEAIGILFDKTA
jgi:flagellar protein FlaG